MGQNDVATGCCVLSRSSFINGLAEVPLSQTTGNCLLAVHLMPVTTCPGWADIDVCHTMWKILVDVSYLLGASAFLVTTNPGVTFS
ncbi:hypothetical protein [Bacillus sp. CECT 9360]|uniref:hypothetical protein n=1 Tax=Bacillus sp. CECT 9360 TaxID=2845821 RepID=UPI001E5CCA58|nr:hypothetical protein [Bacillus sp. CECT 9360]